MAEVSPHGAALSADRAVDPQAQPPARARDARPRYAVYFAPAVGSAWHAFGLRWLSGEWLSADARGQRQNLLASPARYGFHATLKAPFRLADGVDAALLMSRVSALATQCRRVPLDLVQAADMGGYVALTPAEQPAPLTDLAARCVLDLDDLRAPLTPDDLAHRQPQRLDERARQLLLAHGYPQVLERFRFHLTLASTRSADDVATVLAAVQEPLARLQQREPLVLDRLCVFEEPSFGQAFERRLDAQLLA